MRGVVRRLRQGTLVLAFALGGVVAVPLAAEAATVSATVKVGSGGLNVRSKPTTASAVTGTLKNRAKVAIACWTTGPTIEGSVRRTNQWDRLTSGRYISHAYVVGGEKSAKCATAPAPTTVTGTVAGSGPVNLRAAPSTSAAIKGQAAAGSRLTLACAASGQYIYGPLGATTQWDRLADGRYISHAYVRATGLPWCAASAPVPTTTMTNEQFIAASVAGAQRGWREYGVPASVTIAQAILESGWGRSALAYYDRNYFGIKCFGTPGGIAKGCHTYRTTECDQAGKCFTTEASFRVYASMADSYRDHGYFLRTNKRYAGAFAYTKDADRFLVAIWKAGYATDPQYDVKCKALMARYDLYRYDTWK
ncbi:sporangiospore maturation cell wall hydrolase GsmA [Rhizomonospora bruguierae]|uniref:sporangiospore maturation cell wall hydrolase GsmA n=1 Tax=Rhizomonospora bruguierae TaxID=1581705 RepID=UPI001BCD6A1E|nr:sporangiospore maturation cell wall hydrolase GsmA [Micromonospora sp. NBRC 107566]